MQSMFTISMRKNRKHARTLRRIQKEMQRIVYARRIRDAGKIIFQERRISTKIKIRCLKNLQKETMRTQARILTKRIEKKSKNVAEQNSFGKRKKIERRGYRANKKINQRNKGRIRFLKTTHIFCKSIL